MNSLQAKKEEKEKEVSILQKDVNLVEISYLQLEDITNRLQELHSKASLAAQGLSEKDILDEQVKGEALLKELSELKVFLVIE